ncbi:pseudouridine synthase [Clostridium transplantifaecale]|uniref:pseudouridine synthase n=1 Tax=Clostridium transplantifaecale TaxID=2479838 RepID=UPI003C12C219
MEKRKDIKVRKEAQREVRKDVQKEVQREVRKDVQKEVQREVRKETQKDVQRETGEIRLNKYLSESGVCSRREADRLIEAGKVTVDGMTAATGMKVLPSQTVTVDGKTVRGKDRPVLLAVNKPRGIVCTTSDKDRAENIVEFLKYPVRIYPIGRLDKDSEGLLLMTNQGELVNRILRSRYGHEKEYLVTVDKPVTKDFIEKMSRGVEILDTCTKPCEVEKTGECSFRIILTQGLNRQIRRMCEALGFHVKTLKRIRIMNMKLGNLRTGESRKITGEEWDELNRILGQGEAD